MHIINYKKLEEMFLGNTDKVEMLVDALKKRIPEWIEEAEEALHSNDIETIRKVCHRIRGAAGTITAEKLENAATNWGDIVKEERHEEISSGYDDLINAINELQQFTSK
ncbi:MAG: Hpt domain-containing protein [Thermodesulfobacteriota bacterium]